MKSQSQVCLHIRHSVHFHPSPFTRPSFPFFQEDLGTRLPVRIVEVVSGHSLWLTLDWKHCHFVAVSSSEHNWFFNLLDLLDFRNKASVWYGLTGHGDPSLISSSRLLALPYCKQWLAGWGPGNETVLLHMLLTYYKVLVNIMYSWLYYMRDNLMTVCTT